MLVTLCKSFADTSKQSLVHSWTQVWLRKPFSTPHSRQSHQSTTLWIQKDYLRNNTEINQSPIWKDKVKYHISYAKISSTQRAKCKKWNHKRSRIKLLWKTFSEKIDKLWDKETGERHDGGPQCHLVPPDLSGLVPLFFSKPWNLFICIYLHFLNFNKLDYVSVLWNQKYRIRYTCFKIFCWGGKKNLLVDQLF